MPDQMDAVNELLNVYLDVTNQPQNLPGMVPINAGTQGWITVYPSGPNQGKAFTPGHAYINVEGGGVRVKSDGTDPNVDFGTFYPAGSFIDWSDLHANYQAMIKRCRVILASGTAARLQISYRN